MKFETIAELVNQGFTSLSEKEKEDFRIDFLSDNKNYNIYKKMVQNHLFNKELSDEEIECLNAEDSYKYNKIKCELIGFGENKIIVNDFLSKGSKLIEFPTVYDYDLNFESFQQHDNLGEKKEDNKNEFILRPMFIKMISNDKFEFSTIMSLESHIGNILLNYLLELADQYYPSEIKKVQKNKEDSLFGMLGFKRDYFGKEKEAKDLSSKSFKSLNTISKLLKAEIKSSDINGTVSLIDKEVDGDFLKIIISSEMTAKKIKWASFIKNIEENKIDESLFDTIIGKYKNLLAIEMEKIQKEIKS